jgi:hypothetical protein
MHGSVESYRGLEDLLFALRHLKSTDFGAINTVIAGPVRPAMLSYLEKLKLIVEKHGLEDKI